MIRGFYFLFAVCSLIFSGCKEEKEAVVPSSYERGRLIYSTRCIACHNQDPHQPGSIGPDVFGSSQELIEARVLRAEYPVGYTPKRSTKAMVALPDLKSEISALADYLNDRK